MKITENYFQYAWKFGLYQKKDLYYNDEPVTIIDPGEQNESSGPDFFNARVKIGDTIWAGNVELHLKASDWSRHEHHKDPAYDSIILHVVMENDKNIFRMNGDVIPYLQITLKDTHLKEYNNLVINNNDIPCHKKISGLENVFIRDWISKLMISRLSDKTYEVFQTLEKNNYDWEETFYLYLGKSFGFRVNSLPFSMLVETVPLKALLRMRKNLMTINAILYGQAGFLEDSISGDEYYDKLRKEYLSIRSLLPDRILFAHSWQFMRLRPANFPTVRISQFAGLVVRRFPLFADILECNDLEELRKTFMLHTHNYWEDHMLFGRPSKRRKYRLGSDSADIIIINSVIPVLFAYAKFRARTDIQDRVLRFLGELPPEKNVIINRWQSAGIQPESAFDTQALLNLYNNYCKERKCLECIIGSKIINGAGG